MTIAGQLTLVKSILTSQPVYLLMALQAPKEIMKLIDAKRKQFLWAGSDQITGGKCKVNWTRSARPRKGGGLGVLHFENSPELYVFNGYGRNGQMKGRSGRDVISLVPKLTTNYLLRPQRLQLEMEKRHHSGIAAGSMGRDRGIWRPICIASPGEKTSPSMRR